MLREEGGCSTTINELTLPIIINTRHIGGVLRWLSKLGETIGQWCRKLIRRNINTTQQNKSFGNSILPVNKLLSCVECCLMQQSKTSLLHSFSLSLGTNRRQHWFILLSFLQVNGTSHFSNRTLNSTAAGRFSQWKWYHFFVFKLRYWKGLFGQ